MEVVLLLVSAVILLSIFTSKLLYRFGVPSMLIFMALGMLFGSDGLIGIQFDNFELANNIATFALVFIMFYGGFDTNWQLAKPVAFKAGLLSFFGTIITVFITAGFASLILKIPFVYGLLIGSVTASTDAASVFSILRSRRLNLKGGLAPLLEIESGSNDPIAYMMTLVSITLITAKGGFSASAILLLFGQQLLFALLISVPFALASVYLLKRVKIEIEGFQSLILISVVLLGFSLCTLINGNGFLCVYIIGIIIGNSKILHKISLIHFFDAFSWIMQIALFFMLGLLSFPSQIPSILLPGVLISLAIIFVSRPIATMSILSWFKVKLKPQLFVSWVGLRGAASIAFTILAVSELNGDIPFDIFHIIFFIALFSVLFQGTLTPVLARKLDLLDDSDSDSVLKTFNDYHEETHAQLMEYTIYAGHSLVGKMIVESQIPEEILIIMIKRNGAILLPKGSTTIEADDVLVLSGENFDAIDSL